MRSINWRMYCAIGAVFEYLSLLSEVLNVSTLRLSKPGSTARIDIALRIRRPAPISSTSPTRPRDRRHRPTRRQLLCQD